MIILSKIASKAVWLKSDRREEVKYKVHASKKYLKNVSKKYIKNDSKTSFSNNLMNEVH